MKQKFTITAILAAALIFSLVSTAGAQEFQGSSLFKFGQGPSSAGTPKTSITSGITSRSATETSVSSAVSTPSMVESIGFPSVEEIKAKNDVSYINQDTYILGPGDRLNVILYGSLSEAATVSVQPDGTITLNPAPPIYVEGLTISKAQRKIYKILNEYYKNLEVKLNIIELRTFQVEILGEVKTPGTYTATATMGVCDAIGLAGGLKETSSLRNIVLKDSKNKKSWRIDFFAWYFKGKIKQNKLLNKNQTIYVPIMKQKVLVEGAFKKTGTYEIVPGEKLSDIISMAEPQPEAVLGQAKVTRICPDEELRVVPTDVEKIIKDPGSDLNFAMADGDTIFVPDMSVYVKKITVIGEFEGANFFKKQVNSLTGREEIIKTSLYNLREGEKVKDVVAALGGLTVKANLEKARIERPLGNGQCKVIPVNLRKLIYQNDECQNIALEAGDTFAIPASPANVYIIGEVRVPGAYPYNVGNKIKEYIAFAGGPTQRARMKQTRVVQTIGDKMVVQSIDLRSILTGRLPEEFEIRPGDVIYVPYADIATWQDIVNSLANVVVILKYFTD